MKNPSTNDIIKLFLHLQGLLSAGVDLVCALQLQTQHKQALQQVIAALRQGNSFCQAMAQHFPLPPLANMFLYQSEIHGDLPRACQLVVSNLQQQQAWRRMIWQLSFYPMLLFCTSVALLWVMLYFVLPEFASLYATLDVPLPPSTKCLLNLADHAPIYVQLGTLVLVCSILLFGLSWRNPSGRYLIEAYFARLPGLKHLIRLHHEYQLALQLGTLLQGGCPLLQAIEVMRLGTTSPLFKHYLSEVHHAIGLGRSLTQSLCRGLLQNHTFLGLLSHAEQTGRLDILLLNLAKRHSDASVIWQEQAKHLIQPCITLVLGGFLGLWILLLYYPMLQLGTNLG